MRRSPEYYRTEMEYTLGAHFVDGNRVEILRNGVEIFPAMLEAIEQAKYSIELVTFVYWTGDIARRFGHALSRRAEEGLRVRVVLDSIGAKKMSRELVDHMSQAGVEIRWFRPLKLWRPWRFDKRTHRKILVCDDRIGFTGGVGIAEEWEGDARHPGEWRETHVRVEGPAVIGLYAAFLDNWNECGAWRWEAIRERVKPHHDGVPIQFVRASSTIGWTESAAMMRSLVSVSHVRLRIVTAYFAPDETLVQTMLDALARGVEVEILVPGKHNDSRISQLAGQPSVERLLTAGAKVWVFAPTMLHAKLAIVDDLLACIGSVNVNHRSMGKDEECSALILSEDLAAILNRQFDEDCQRSRCLDADEFRQRGAWTRCKERAARLVLEQV
ncbi:phospholipase D-like domain-containing protein [Halomonas salipaludis]|uniref:Cardiolipin synthase B n=1 Tax=Halomonas salipaludis TaxID=2032625 RepID=A0A2A2EVD0_9GAMM|nr:phospholipase D-like domain-containing protein [Halomonas salipaludis]PAU76520.1 cardiolipin synthase B [Halomonas salipaludis]